MGNKGGIKRTIWTGITLVILVAIVLGWAKVNNINSFEGVYTYFKSVSDKIWSCGAGKLEWNCKTNGSSHSNNGSSGSGTSGNENGSTTGNETKQANNVTVTKTESLQQLENVKIADAQEISYKRSDWKHWIGEPCNTRENVLIAQGSDVKTDPATCKVISGKWVDPYSGDTFTEASKLDIDHVIPLSYAAQHGGQAWDSAKKQQFANDTDQLLAVSASENRGKSDKGPSEYMPPNKDYRCEYSKKWVSTANKYGVTISKKDKTTLTAELQKCNV